MLSTKRTQQVISQTVGFRSVRIVTDPLPDGATFYFEVNRVPVFIKGSNCKKWRKEREKEINKARKEKKKRVKINVKPTQ